MKSETHNGLQSMYDSLNGFFGWWQGTLVEMLPAALRRPSESTGDLLLVRFERDRVVLNRRRQAQWSELGGVAETATPAEVAAVLGSARSRKQTIVARLPAGKILRRHMQLPLAAEKELRQILAYQLDTLSPYPPDKVHFSYRILKRNYAERTLEVEVCLLPKADLERVTERMHAWGLKPDVVDFDDGEPLAAPLLNLLSDPHTTSRPASPLSRTNKLLLAVNLLLVAALVVGKLSARTDSETRLQTRVETMRLKAEATTKLRDRLEQLRTERNMLLNKKLDRPPVVTLIDELTSILPDQTWLERASYDGESIRLSGLSSKAAVLISAIENSALFENAAFQASVVQDDRSGGERFQISATISRIAHDAE